MTTDVYHEYAIRTNGKSAYGKAKMILEALEPLKKLHYYGYIDEPHENRIRIWWRTVEEVSKP